jgi:translation initiation factor IF-2
MNLLVEDWGGKIQSHDISAKTGLGVKELLEKVLLEAELLDLKANAKKAALGTVVEAFLDKGRGYVSTVLVQSGTLKVGDYVLAGKHHGKIKAMHDERGHDLKIAGPSQPVSLLGLDGAPTAGDKFNVFEDEREAKQIAAKRTQLIREQSVRAQRHITLAEIGRRIDLGQFK